MKLTILLIACACGLAAQPAPKPATPKAVAPKKTKTVAKKAEAPPEPSGLPATAKQMPDGDWRWVDAKGTAWIYHRGMMGYSRWPEKNAPRASAPTGIDLQVEDLGETVRFSRRSPFSTSTWTKKKSDQLDSDEQAALDALKLKEKQ
ncbi:MAG: hypothetical protein NTV70_18985 [Acidobacteria bacterium]|nr:hypothetical protein [Acidobacteriota bacterium]